jgi:hypothetical protein
MAAAAAASELNKYPVSWKWYPILFTWQVPAPKSGMKWGIRFWNADAQFHEAKPSFSLHYG